ncbi:MAG: class I tRNA ligase family protein, partial [Candidatus Heimdallarchaeota archaeon]|nr:class I tRNA ligase family protein [Candidatus Heimdallarchaeota archaeon]
LICSKSYAVKNKHEIIKDINANDLIGITYQSLFDYFKNHKGAFTVMSADFVVDGEGTGIVHIAPGFGEDDFHLCKANNIEYVCPVNESGCYTDEIYDLKDMNVLQANDEVIKKLKNNGNWFATEQYIHNYPHCWRTDEPLIYKAVSSWYIRVTDLKDRMIELNKTVNWYPDHVKEGQFGKWLENVRDWSVSRERFWGTPLPIWESDNPKYPRIDVYGSIEELERDFNVKVNDLHSHHLDKLVRNNPDDPTGKSKMCRIGGVFDCWFESGSMPFAQMHYPFENKEKFEKNSPADFITEYIAQTRGWFYTMFVLSVALFDRIPFKNCVCHGVVLDVKGQKLSKRLNNYEDPLELFNKYGSDSLRFLMLSSSVVGGGNLLIDKECIAVKDIFRTVLMPIWNAYHFFCMYANADKIGELELITLSDLNNNQDAMNYEIDSWILIKIDLLFHQNSLSNYNTQDICKSIINFIDDLNNWYIRCNRERFWQTEITNNKIIAYRILYTVLCYFAITIAPLLPIISEYIWQGLNFKSVYNIESVHLAIFDKKLYIEDEKKIYLRPDHYGRRFSPLQSIKQMDFVKNICNTTLAIRDKLNIRIRQPLNSIMIYVKYGNDVVIEQLKDNSSPYSILLKEQTNVKNIKIKDDLFYTIATKKIKINFKNLSRDILKHTKKIMDAVKNNQYEETENELHIDIGSGEIFVLTLGEYTAIWEPKDENTMIYDNRIAVQLDTEITEELKLEGISRDIVRHIQQKRKDKGLYVMDRIEINLYSDDKVYKDVLDVHIDYIKHVTLADEIIFTDKKINDYDDIYDDNLYIKLTIV